MAVADIGRGSCLPPVQSRSRPFSPVSNPAFEPHVNTFRSNVHAAVCSVFDRFPLTLSISVII